MPNIESNLNGTRERTIVACEKQLVESCCSSILRSRESLQSVVIHSKQLPFLRDIRENVKTLAGDGRSAVFGTIPL